MTLVLEKRDAVNVLHQKVKGLFRPESREESWRKVDRRCRRKQSHDHGFILDMLRPTFVCDLIRDDLQGAERTLGDLPVYVSQ